MTRRLQRIGNSAGTTGDEPTLEPLGIAAENEIELSIDANRLIATPLATTAARGRRIAELQKQVLRDHETTFRKLAR